MKNLSLTLFAFFLSLAAYAALPPITGVMTLCESATTTLSNTTTGGTWSSGTTSVAGISTSGVVTGLAFGTSIITYTDGVDEVYATVTVNALPAAITGSPAICTGGTTTLSSTTPGGTWASSSPSVATISFTTGIATGVSAGTSHITYTIPTGCFRTMVVTVNPIPPAITGVTTVCVGGTTVLSNAASGGVWISSIPGVAGITSAGIITGVTAGTTTISYMLGTGCSSTTVVSVNPGVITPITGTPTVCVGMTTLLSNTTPGGSWSSSNAAIAAPDAAGVVTGYTLGTTHISYVLPSGCNTSITITVNATPGTITGTATVCAGATTTLGSSSGSGGTWSSTATGIATVSTGGVVFGAGIGTATISYTTASCGSSSRVVTVNSSCSGTPVPGAITASSSVICSGTGLVLNLPSYTPSCGQIAQWQYSTDGLSWSNLSGANTVPYTYYPTAAYYYRCGITCASTGASAFSGPVHVTIDFSIGAHSVIAAPDTACAASHFYLAACGVSSAFSAITFFGDGTSDTSALSTTTLSSAHIYHAYSLPGTYTVQHILFVGTTVVDTVTFSYDYLYCRTLPIKFYKDNNSNCIFDAGDTYNLLTMATEVDSNGIHIDTISSTSGFYYKALGGPGTVYRFRPLTVTGGMGVACPATGYIYDTIVSYANTYVTKYFGLSCISTSGFDLGVAVSSVSSPTRENIYVTVRNNYCTAVSPVLTVTFSPKYGYYPTMWPCSSSWPAPTSVVGNTATWNLPPITASGTQNISLYLLRPAGLGTPLPLGDTSMYTISITPTIGDMDLSNNTVTKIDTVRASFDPNDIAVLPEGYILPCTELQYTIRFENTGNDTAHNVSVLDTLSPGLDPSTIIIQSSSDPMNISVINSGGYTIAKFDFPNINLLDSGHHGQNDGMFVYKIKARNGLTDGTTIENRVGIYFDDNPVILTNTVTNTIGIAPIAGPDNVCLGYPAPYFNTTAGGIWASSTPTVATITSTGAATGVIAGTSTISYTVTNSCTSRTATKVVTVSPVVVPAVSISSSMGDTVCSSSTVVFTATPTAGGIAPDYIWRVNGIGVGIGDTYTYTPTIGDTVTVALTSNAACAMPAIVADTLPMTVIAMATPNVMLTASPGDTSCAGTPVSFTATPAYGGPTPGYLWFVNGALSGSGVTYTYVPTNGDVIYCRMGSNFMCRLADTVNSSNINMTVDPLYIPVVSITPSPSLFITAGESLTLTATATSTGPTPTYQWLVNGLPIAGATNTTYTSTTFADYDSVTCKVTGSGICNISSFNWVFITVYPVGVANVVGGDKIHLFPNPNKGGFMIKGTFGTVRGTEVGLTINNVLGQVVYRNILTTGDNGTISEAVNLPFDVANGMYILNMRADNENKMFRFVIDK